MVKPLDLDLDAFVDDCLSLVSEHERNPLETFRPTPPQLELMQIRHRWKMARLPNQVGKTTVGAYEAVSRLDGSHPVLGDLGEQHGWVLCKSWKQSLIIQEKVYEICPKDRFHETVSYTKKNGFSGAFLQFENGSSLRFITGNQDVLSLASGTIDFVWIDEPCPEHVWGELISRVRNKETPGVWSILLTLTPIGAPVGWIRDLVESGQIQEVHMPLTEENVTPEGGIPFLTQKQIDDWSAGLMEFERAQRVEAAWEGVTQDRWLTAFEASTVSDDLLVDSHDGEVSVAVGIDHGAKAGRQLATLVYYWVGKVDREIKFHIWDEAHSSERSSSDEDAQNILDMLARNDITLRDVDMVIGDRAHGGDRFGNSKTNQELTEALARIACSGNKRRLPHAWSRIPTPYKYDGSVKHGMSLMNKLMAAGRLKVRSNCPKFIEGASVWNGDSRAPEKDALDAPRYPIEKAHARHIRRPG